MKAKQIYSILAGAFYVIGVFRIADNGLTVMSILYVALGTVFAALSANTDKGNKNGSN